MAGGSGGNRQGGSFDKANPWLYHHHLYPRLASKPPVSESFKQRRGQETKRTCLQNIKQLQEHILRIFTESLHCDLEIVQDYKIIRTNRCIVKTRSPNFYKALEPRFVYRNRSIECALDNPGIFHQVESFVRLLYSNLDLSQEELLLVELILSTSQSIKQPCTNNISRFHKRTFEEIPLSALSVIPEKTVWENYNIQEHTGDSHSDAPVVSSPASSDMADSGLETGSASLHENTASETSGVDLEESQAAEDISTDEDSNKVTLRDEDAEKHYQTCVDFQQARVIDSKNGINEAKISLELAVSKCITNKNTLGTGPTCSFVPLDSSGSSDENAQKLKERAEEVSQYENQVLNDPFYESDCESDENERTNSFVPTESFEFIDPVNISPINSEPEKELKKYEAFNKVQDEKLNTNPEARSMTTEELRHELSHSNDLPIKKSSSSTSSYYFIDASSLNDEEEVVLPVDAPKDRHFGSRVPSYISSSSDYASDKSLTDEQPQKFTSRKLASLQSGHERVAEFEKELKLTEHLEPFIESRKIKRLDSTSEDKPDVEKSVEKEALVVEIKEADSGESARASPCPDNSKSIVNNKTDAGNVFESITGDALNDKTSERNVNEEESQSSDETRRPSLIRRNTFELDPNEEKLAVLRQEYERHQGSLVFQSSIPQYSGHRVDGDSCFEPPLVSSMPIIDDVLNASSVDVPHPTTLPCTAVSQLKDLDKKFTEDSNSIFFLEKSSISSDSVVPLSKGTTNQAVADRIKEPEPVTSCSSVLPEAINCKDGIENRPMEPGKRSKCVEAIPIVSGGVSTLDFSKPTDSPVVRRKTESTPIVSGGSVIMDEPEVKVKPSRMSSSMTSWVVDMSDWGRKDGKPLTTDSSSYESMSQSFSSGECIPKSTKKSKATEKHGSLGFFVNLKNMSTPKETQSRECKLEKKEQNGSGKPYCEFFIDLSSANETPKKKKDEAAEASSKEHSSNSSGDKRNIFSMFIDLNESTEISKTETCAANADETKTAGGGVFSKMSEKLSAIERSKADSSDFEENGSSSERDPSALDQKLLKERSKQQSVFMFIESDSPVVRRRTLSSSRPAFQRHSWNFDKTQSANGNGHSGKEPMFKKEHKRAHSLSVDRSDLRRQQAKTSNSSHSLSEVARADTLNGKNPKRLLEQENNRNMDTSSEDVFEFDTRDTPPNSHIEIVNEELRVSIKHHDYKELAASEIEENFDGETKAFEEEYSEISVWDKTGTESTEGHTRKSETFDISSGSGPSPGSDNQDSELSELLNGDTAMPDRQIVPPIGHKISETQKSLNEKIKKIECELKSPEYNEQSAPNCNKRCAINTKKEEKKVTEEAKGMKSAPPNKAGSSFVRLSDLDATPARFDSSEILTSKEDRVKYRMSSSIPETSWIESKLVMSRSSGPMRTLSRKFASAMTTSLPAKQKSPLDELQGADAEGEGVISESDISSMQSSMGRSGAEGSTEETETSSLAGAKPYNRLGEDLLRMFLEEINPDVTIDVAGRRIRAHKCILSSRCQYFAAILSGGWVESAGNLISLQGYSYNSVHFALCHIYSGESNIPDSISIVELATLADMLCLEGLKEVISYTLKVKYCHLFHKPCQICAVGVLECMPLAAAYGLDEVYRKSLRWITRHFVRIWPCKAFAILPRELMDKCYHQHIVHMSTDNVLQTMMDCDKLLATLPNVRWAEPVFRLVSNLLETAVKFLSDNFSGLLGNEKFQALGRELSWNISRLEDNVLAAADRLPPEQACKSYSKLSRMLATARSEDVPPDLKWGQLFVDFLQKIYSHVEKCLVREAPRAARTTTWLKMDLELRRRIQELACLVILPHETSKRQSRHSNFLKEPRALSSRSLASRSLDLRRVKMVISEHNDKALKQASTTTVPQVKRLPLTINKPKSDPLERKVQEDKQASIDSVNRPKSWPNKIEVKARYLEPRNKSVAKEIVTQAHPDKVIAQQRRKIMISSSDSSRTSSPAMKRAVDKKPLAKIKLPIKKDVKALSSDSLAEANPEKANRKDSISKSCGITRPESPSLKQKDAEIGLSVDSLAEAKKKPVAKKKTGKMDTSMSTDSLMTDVTATPKSNISNKLSPTLGRGVNKTQAYERTKKASPPMQQRSPLTIARKVARSVEGSTAASRNKAVPVTPYHGSPNLRRNLLDAAKTPDVPSKSLHSVLPRPNLRQTGQSAVTNIRSKRETLSGQQSLESPSKKSSPKSNGAHKMNKPLVGIRRVNKGADDKVKTKCHNGEAVKQPTVGSRSGTFLKDEPTILKKPDIKSSQTNV